MMFRRAAFICSLLLLLAAPVCAETAQTTRTVVSFRSESLGRQVEYVALLPEPIEQGRRYPVLYLLHGATGNSRDWSERTSLTQVLAGRPLIVINPDGGEFGWYLDSRLKPESQYESFMIRDLVADVDARFPTVAARDGRAIAGLSMGGHGAMMLAARNPDVFASASSMSGILNIANHPGKWHLDDVLGKLPQAAAEWSKWNVYDLAERYTTASVSLLFDSGTSDTAAIGDNRQLHERLVQLGVDHVYREFPGAHTWRYWSDRLPEHLAFHEAVLRKHAPRP